MSDVVVQNHWNEYAGWSKAADRLKRNRDRARNTVLLLTIAGAVLQTVAATWPPLHRPAGLAGFIALGLVPFIAGQFLKPEETRKWLRARAISEGIKSEIYTYRAGAAPYDQADALDGLTGKVKAIGDWGKDILMERVRAGSVSDAAPGALDRDAYLAQRVNDQVSGYYEPNAKRNADLAQRYRWLEILFAGAAAVLSAVATFGEAGVGPWVAVVTTIGGTIASYAAAGRYEFQATAFYATAAQLKDQVGELASGRKQWSEFVRSCEEAISAENRAWMAKLDEKSDGG